MRFRYIAVVTVAAAAAAVLVPACSNPANDCSQSLGACGGARFDGGGGSAGTSGSGGMSGGGGTAGVDGGGGSGGVAGNGGAAGSDAGKCDTSKTPSTESCLVSDQYAVFVDGTAASGGDGSKASPFNKIGDAIAAAGTKMILVCDTTYDEQVKLTAGVHLYGGFKCSDWSYETGKRAVVAPTATGYALEVDSVTDPVVIEDMEFDAQDATAAGGSSIAAFVHGSSDVALHRDKLVAGKGKTGKKGVRTDFTYLSQNDLNGNSANLTAGGGSKACSCPAGDITKGGAGGDAPTANGGDGKPDLGAGQGGTAKAPSDCSVGIGKNGNSASAASPASGAATSGTLASTGWTPSKGSDGKAGGPGQGGGGGASSATAGGGGGGCGGCGGAGGPAGGGGGASIALMVFDLTVSVDAGSELDASDAGAGGQGAAGQAGQTIYGFGGLPAVGGACQGGNGGTGGDGAAGGGGAGGISVAVLWKGSAAPTIDSGATMTFGAKGAAGQGGKAGTNDGVDGVAQNVLEAK